MLKKCIAALALSVLCASGAAGQSPAAPSAPAAAVAPARPTVEQFAAGPNFTSASLSPSGRYIAGIKHLEDAQMLVVFDRQTGRWSTVQRAVEAEGVGLAWVGWKNDERLLIGARFKLVRREDDSPWISRVLSSPRTGGATVTMFENQTSRLAVSYAATKLVSRLPHDPEHVLLAAYADIGLALWKANVNTGRVQRVEVGNWNTTYWALDLHGTPILRRDEMYRNSGYRMFRRTPGTREWIQFFEEKRAAAINADEFEPHNAAPGVGQVYVSARPAGRDLNAL